MRNWERPPWTSRARRLLSRAGDLVLRRRRDADLDEEIAAHLELAAAEQRAKGLSDAAARAAAARHFGGVLRTKETYRERRGSFRVEALFRDLKYGIRSLRKAPLFALTAVAVLAVGIGADAAVFSVINAVLLRPLPFPDSSAIVQVRRRTGFGSNNSFDIPDYLALHADHPGLSELAILDFGSGGYNLVADGAAEQVDGIRVSATFFSVFKVTPLAGRLFLDRDSEPGQPPRAVISEAFWRRRFNGDPSAIGRPVIINHDPYTIVGVAPDTLRLFTPADVYLSLPVPTASSDRMNAFRVVGRLRSGWSIKSADAQLDAVALRHAKGSTTTNMPGGIVLHAVQDDIVASSRLALEVLFVAVAFVLLIACTNIANLTLTRGLGRERELATMAALGAPRARIVERLLAESLVISVAAGVVALLLVDVLLRGLPILWPEGFPAVTRITLDGQVLGFVALTAILSGVIAGAMPAVHLTRGGLAERLKWSGGARSHRASRLRAGLVIAQIALSTALLAGALLLIRSFANLTMIDPGFRADHVLTMRVNLATSRYGTSSAVARYAGVLARRLAQVPGIIAASPTTTLPSEAQFDLPATIVGRPGTERGQDLTLEPFYRAIGPDYFSVMGITLRDGRVFRLEDTAGAAPVVIVSQTFARRAFPNRNALGQAVVLGRGLFEDARDLAPLTIVGIAGDTHDAGLSSEPWPLVYVPNAQAPERMTTLLTGAVPERWVIRTVGDPGGVVAEVRRAVLSVDSTQPAAHIEPLEQVLAGSISSNRFNMLVLDGFALAALCLAGIGLYGLTAYTVAQHEKEIGIRLSLGGPSHVVIRLFVWRSIRLALFGVALGLVLFLTMAGLLRHLLFGITPSDPGIVAGVIVAMLALAIVATYIPARRVAAVDPLVALRTE